MTKCNCLGNFKIKELQCENRYSKTCTGSEKKNISGKKLIKTYTIYFFYSFNDENQFNVENVYIMFTSPVPPPHSHRNRRRYAPACLMTDWCSLKDRGHLLAAGGPHISRIPSWDHNSLLFDFVFQCAVLRSAQSCERLFSQRAVCPESRIASLC